MFKPPEGSKEDPRPLILVVDSKGQVRCWEALRLWPYFRGFVAFCSATTPAEYQNYLEKHRIGVIITGSDQIDICSALEALHQHYAVRTVRSDSGGTLNSVFLQAGLVSELSVLIHPFLAGGQPDPTIFDPVKAGMPDLQIPLTLPQVRGTGTGNHLGPVYTLRTSPFPRTENNIISFLFPVIP